jgi:tellurite resistance protein TehA-like permease
MKLDVRTPIGAMFALDGVVLAIYGAVADQADAIKKAGGNVTLTWGEVLMIFGGAMLALAIRDRRNAAGKV